MEPGNAANSFCLVLPRATVVSGQMLVSLELGIAVRGQHLTVGVNLDAGVLGLLQQRGQIGKIVAADQDGLTGDRVNANRGGRGISVRVGVDLIQQGHHAQVQLTNLERVAQQLIQRGRRTW